MSGPCSGRKKKKPRRPRTKAQHARDVENSLANGPDHGRRCRDSGPRRRHTAYPPDDPEAEAYHYDLFSCNVLSNAVMCVLKMGGCVDWDRVAKFLRQSASPQNISDSVSTRLHDSDTYAMDTTMHAMYTSLMDHKRRYRR